MGLRLHERGRELDRVESAIDAACSDVGALLVVEGPAGIGKTALLNATRERASARGLSTLGAAGGELESDAAFGVVRQLIEPRLARADENERADLLHGAAALAAPLLHPRPHGTPLGPEAEHAALHGLYWLTAGLAARAPLALVVDDLHWADEPSLRFLLYLAQRLEGMPLLLALAFRESEPGTPLDLIDRLAQHPFGQFVRPSPLSEAAAGELMGELLDAPIDTGLRRACHQATGGNPFLLQALAVELRETGLDHARAERVAAIGPARLARTVERRLAPLGPEALALVRAVAILQRDARPELVGALAGIDPGRTRELTATLAAAGVLLAGESLAFVHPIVREAIASEIPPGEKGAAHAHAARLLRQRGAPLETLASHLLAATPSGDDDAVETLLAAGRRAAGAGAPALAVTYLERALAEDPEPGRRHELLLELGRAAASAGSTEATKWLREAVESAPGAVDRAVAALELGRALTVTERLTEATEVLERASAELDERHGSLALALEAGLIAASNLDGRLRAVARQRVARIDPSLEPRGLPECMLLALLAVEQALRGESAETTAAIGERALAGGWLVNGDPMTLGYVASALSFAGRLERASTVLGEGIEAARRRGAPLSVAVLAGMRSHVQLVAGRVADAEADARTSLDLAVAYGPHPSLAFAAAFLADALLERGDLDGAEGAVTEGFRVPGVERQYAYLPLLDSRGRVRLEQGRMREALEDFLECGRRHADWGGYNPALVQWQGHAAVAHAALGDNERASDLARDDVERARRFGAPWLVGATLRLLATTEPPGRRADPLRHALAELEGSEAALERARVLVDLGATVLEREGPAAAREALRRALDAAVRCGATVLAERARADLRAAGGRPRRAALSGADALTASERRIAVLARRMTNREIAEAEFVTVKTVEFHLRNAYRKLGVSGREGLDAALDLGKDSGAY